MVNGRSQCTPGPAGLNVPAGRRITLEAHLDSTAIPSLVDPVVLDSKDNRLPDPVVVDGDGHSRQFAGRRVLSIRTSRRRPWTDRRLQLTLTTHGVQLVAEVRRPDAVELAIPDRRERSPSWRCRARQSGARNPCAACGGLRRRRRTDGRRPDRQARAPIADIGGGHPGAPREEAAAGHPVKLSARIMVWDAEWSVLFVHDGAGIFVFTRSLEHPMPRVRPGDVAEIEGETGPGNSRPSLRRIASQSPAMRACLLRGRCRCIGCSRGARTASSSSSPASSARSDGTTSIISRSS